MKFLLLATFVVFCAASTLYRGKNISVNEDGSIVITSSFSGKRVVITKPVGYNGQKTIDITVSGPNMPTKRIQIDDEKNRYEIGVGGNRYQWSSVDSIEDEQMRGKRSFKGEKSQADVLFTILREYQGPVPEPLFEKLLVKIDKAVRKGEISRQIYDLLVELDQIDDSSSVIGDQVGLGGQTVVPERSVTWYTRVVPQIQGGRVVLAQEQIPLVPGVSYGQSWGTTRYVNPLLERWLQGQILTGQQFNSGISGGLQSQQNILDEILARQQLVSGTPLTFQGQQNILDQILERQQLLGRTPQSLQAQQNIVDEILARQQLTGGVPLSFQTRQNIVDEIVARQQLNGGVPLSPQTQQNIIDEILARQQLQAQQNIAGQVLVRQQLNGGRFVSPQTEQNLIDEILTRQQLVGGVPLSLQAQQNIADQVLVRQQLNGGVPSSFQTRQNIIDEILARQQLMGVPLSRQAQQNIADQILARQQLNGQVPLSLQTQQNIIDEILARQQLMGGSLSLQTQQDIIDEVLSRQQFGGVSSGLQRPYQTGQNLLGAILTRQQLRGGVTGGYQTRQGALNQFLTRQQLNGGQGVVDQMFVRQQPIGGIYRGYQSGQNNVEEMLEQQQLDNDIASLQTEQDVANGLLIQQEQQQLQEQLGGLPSGLQRGQSIVGNLLRPQQLNSGIPAGSNVLLKEYLSGSQPMPYSQRQSFGTLLGLLRNRPTGSYYQGVKEGYRMRQVQPTIMQNGRRVYMDNMGVPQVVY